MVGCLVDGDGDGEAGVGGHGWVGWMDCDRERDTEDGLGSEVPCRSIGFVTCDAKFGKVVLEGGWMCDLLTYYR